MKILSNKNFKYGFGLTSFEIFQGENEILEKDFNDLLEVNSIFKKDFDLGNLSIIEEKKTIKKEKN